MSAEEQRMDFAWKYVLYTPQLVLSALWQRIQICRWQWRLTRSGRM